MWRINPQRLSKYFWITLYICISNTYFDRRSPLTDHVTEFDHPRFPLTCNAQQQQQQQQLWFIEWRAAADLTLSARLTTPRARALGIIWTERRRFWPMRNYVSRPTNSRALLPRARSRILSRSRREDSFERYKSFETFGRCREKAARHLPPETST